jgi:Ala-tRNA(Pro) deacylase
MSTYDDLIALLDKHGADYTLIDHEPEGSTEAVSAMRGNPPGHAAKCLMLIVKPDRRTGGTCWRCCRATASSIWPR